MLYESQCLLFKEYYYFSQSKYLCVFPPQQDGGGAGSSQSFFSLGHCQPAASLGHPDAVCGDVCAYEYF